MMTDFFKKVLILVLCFWAVSISIYFIKSFFWKFSPYYVENNPYQYITLVSITLFISLFIFRSVISTEQFFKSNKIKVFFFASWLAISCVFGGVLYAYHEINDTTTRLYLIDRSKRDIGLSLFYGPLFLIIYFPYNLLCVLSFNWLLIRFFIKKQKKSD